jgi:hypothetical protein
LPHQLIAQPVTFRFAGRRNGSDRNIHPASAGGTLASRTHEFHRKIVPDHCHQQIFPFGKHEPFGFFTDHYGYFHSLFLCHPNTPPAIFHRKPGERRAFGDGGAEVALV